MTITTTKLDDNDGIHYVRCRPVCCEVRLAKQKYNEVPEPVVWKELKGAVCSHHGLSAFLLHIRPDPLPFTYRNLIINIGIHSFSFLFLLNMKC